MAQEHHKAYLYAHHLLLHDPQQPRWLKEMGLALKHLGYPRTAHQLLMLYRQAVPHDQSILAELNRGLSVPLRIPSGPPHTSVVVPLYRESEWNPTLLKTLLKTPELNELWLIGPNHGSMRDWLYLQAKQHQPQIRLLLCAESYHPAHLNQALDLCHGPYVLLLKDQVAVPQGWLARLQQALRNNLQHVIGWQTETLNRDALCNEMLASHEGLFEESAQQWAQQHSEQCHSVEKLALGGWMMTKDTLHQVGGLACHLSIEPDGTKEWCQRVRQLGKHLYCLSTVYTLSQWQVDPLNCYRHMFACYSN